MKVIEQTAKYLHAKGRLTDTEMVWLITNGFVRNPNRKDMRQLERRAIKEQKPKMARLSEVDEVEEMVVPLLQRDNQYRTEAHIGRLDKHARKRKHTFAAQRKKRVTKLRHNRRTTRS